VLEKVGMAPKVIMAKAKAKAKAKALPKAAPMGGIVAAGGAPVMGMPPVQALALHANEDDINMVLVDAVGMHSVRFDRQGLSAMWGVPVTLSHHEVSIRPTGPVPGKGVGKGMGPWAPVNNWELRLTSEVDQVVPPGGVPAPIPSGAEVRFTQNGVQLLLD